MGRQTRRKINRPNHTKHPKPMKSFCHIPIPPLASTYSSLEVGRDFYGLVNNEWISKVSVPLFENDFGASEELERCIFRESSKILMGMKHKRTSSVFKSLAESCFSKDTSVDYLKRILASVNCIETKEDVVKHFAALAHAQLPSVFKYRYSILPNRKTHVCISSGLELLPLAYYRDYEKSEKYKQLLNTVGDLFGLSNLSQIYELEKTLIANQENMWSDNDLSAKGSALISKFPGIPWATWFKNSGDEMASSWKARKIWYTSPKWIRFVGKVL
jgi:predicted metalloendopeptidase